MMLWRKRRDRETQRRLAAELALVQAELRRQNECLAKVSHREALKSLAAVISGEIVGKPLRRRGPEDPPDSGVA
jgi:hypothetical protein